MSRCGVPGFLVDDGSHDGLLGCNRRLYEYLGQAGGRRGVVWAGGVGWWSGCWDYSEDRQHKQLWNKASRHNINILHRRPE